MEERGSHPFHGLLSISAHSEVANVRVRHGTFVVCHKRDGT